MWKLANDFKTASTKYCKISCLKPRIHRCRLLRVAFRRRVYCTVYLWLRQSSGYLVRVPYYGTLGLLIILHHSKSEVGDERFGMVEHLGSVERFARCSSLSLHYPEESLKSFRAAEKE